MKQISCFSLIFICVLLFSHSTTCTRILSAYQGEQKVLKANGITHAASSIKTKEYDDLFGLMGLEECADHKDEECLKRRVVAEAHLDYIYTQHHKPKG
ncbi:hypothetical protein F0562_016821 [Nyssa sinensis]|uniref:Phytosulfokine n=1 Tax=Nyssa sinensis TaxID=561372 RepID=A0A5J4ZDL0_9ASTE|nr:hypothetical protein F0562_016821 [Nyssa sinensis]